jgi:dynein heavy chain
MYQSLLHCAKNSMNALKKRIGFKFSRKAPKDDNLESVQPFFVVNIQLASPNVMLQPSLDEIQECINRSAQAILKCFKSVKDWSLDHIDVLESKSNRTFFDKITKDIEIVRVSLLLTGCIQGIRNTVQDYLNTFRDYNWLWEKDKDAVYLEFIRDNPSIDDFELKLRSFGAVDNSIAGIPDTEHIGALSLNTKDIKDTLTGECKRWKLKFSDNLHSKAKAQLDNLSEFMRLTEGKIKREVTDLDSLGVIMKELKNIRDRESSMEMEIQPMETMYRMLDNYLSEYMDKEEDNKKTRLRKTWTSLLKQAEVRTSELKDSERFHKRRMVKDIKDFKIDVKNFREDFVKNGPLVDNLTPNEASDRLAKFKEQWEIRDRKMRSYQGGEVLFALPVTQHPEIKDTDNDIKRAESLFNLYKDVLGTLDEWNEVPWSDVVLQISDWTTQIEASNQRFKKLNPRLREYSAYTMLKDEIEGFMTILPLLQEMSKPSIKDRHWEHVREITGHPEVDEKAPDFKLKALRGIGMIHHEEEILDVTDSADKQLKIEKTLSEVMDKWKVYNFNFKEMKGRPIQVLQGQGQVMEDLEEAQMTLTGLLTNRNIAPFREEADTLYQSLSNAAETLDQWGKVQQLWMSLESVFTGGDIAKQMPAQAKQFGAVDKNFVKIMSKAFETKNVVDSCANENLNSLLPSKAFPDTVYHLSIY